MNPVLEQIITALEVTDGTVTFPVRHPSVQSLPVAIDPEGRFLGRLIEAVKPSLSLEIGMAYPASATARSITRSSSRTLPGQLYARRASIAPSDSRNILRPLCVGILFASVRSSTPPVSQGYRQWLRAR